MVKSGKNEAAVEGLTRALKKCSIFNQYPDVSGTKVSIATYHNSTGIIMRTQSKKILQGYCQENSRDVLRILLPKFYVTSYCGIDFYDSSVSGVPMAGISIDTEKRKGVYGWKNIVDGKLEELLEMDMENFNELKRQKPLSDREKLRIIKTINTPEDNGLDIQKVNEAYIRATVDVLAVLTSF